ncbi:MAG: peptidoglycan editing factor PgeF [Rhodocyclaceae bacterium]|nr:peptidoglycan editing factor PgeF [Rhodocyclaceae bacterium]
MSDRWIEPDWPAPSNVRALVTTRHGGVSVGPYSSMNLGTHVGDDAAAVAANRSILRRCLPSDPCWLEQVHGVDVAVGETVRGVPQADASVARTPGVVLAVMTADCLPVLLCDRAGSVVGIAHAGWRGLVGGVIEATLAAMEVEPGEVLAWLGPAIGPASFEVGGEVRDAAIAAQSSAARAFAPCSPEKWLADLYALARLRLERAGVNSTRGGNFCTVHDAERFYSFRRDRITGRMASLIWLAAPAIHDGLSCGD